MCVVYVYLSISTVYQVEGSRGTSTLILFGSFFLCKVRVERKQAAKGTQCHHGWWWHDPLGVVVAGNRQIHRHPHSTPKWTWTLKQHQDEGQRRNDFAPYQTSIQGTRNTGNVWKGIGESESAICAFGGHVKHAALNDVPDHEHVLTE